MTRKIIDVNNPPSIKPGMTEAVMKAFQEHALEETEIRTQPREHIAASFQKGMCCAHQWQPVAPTDENLTFLKQAFEETDLGPEQLFCKRCGATMLRDGGVWAYDATTRFYGRVPKARQEQAREGKRK